MLVSMRNIVNQHYQVLNSVPIQASTFLGMGLGFNEGKKAIKLFEGVNQKFTLLRPTQCE